MPLPLSIAGAPVKFFASLQFAVLSFALLVAASHSARASQEELVATCKNKETTYEFYTGARSKIAYVVIKEKPYPAQKVTCYQSKAKDEEVFCAEKDGGLTDQVNPLTGEETFSKNDNFDADQLVLYTKGYAIMHRNTTSDSNYDEKAAQCTGSYFQ
jgi:hypothetical protein